MEAKNEAVEHEGYVKEALEFVGVTETNSIEVQIVDGPVDGMQIVNWKVASKQLPVPVAGSYKLGSAGDARLQVVMSLGLISHRYGAYIYQMILACDNWMMEDPKLQQHNSPLEIFVRQAIAEAIYKMPVSQVKPHVQKLLYMDANIEFVNGLYTLAKEHEKVKSLVRNKYKGNGK
jgi:hypothetical protein